ncbi:MAG: hypothetical protein AAGJ83_13930 [Planctomycetota bacterium]
MSEYYEEVGVGGAKVSDGKNVIPFVRISFSSPDCGSFNARRRSEQIRWRRTGLFLSVVLVGLVAGFGVGTFVNDVNHKIDRLELLAVEHGYKQNRLQTQVDALSDSRWSRSIAPIGGDSR